MCQSPSEDVITLPIAPPVPAALPLLVRIYSPCHTCTSNFFLKQSNNKFLSCSETIRIPATKTHTPGDWLPAHKYTQSQIHFVGSNQHLQCTLHHVNMMVCRNRWCHNILPRDSILLSLVSQSAPTFSHRWDLGSVQAMSSYLLWASLQARQKLSIHLFRRRKKHNVLSAKLLARKSK